MTCPWLRGGKTLYPHSTHTGFNPSGRLERLPQPCFFGSSHWPPAGASAAVGRNARWDVCTWQDRDARYGDDALRGTVVRLPRAVHWGFLEMHLLQTGQRCLDTDAGQGARGAVVPPERGGAGRGRARSMQGCRSTRSQSAPPVPRRRGDWEPPRWGRARVRFNLRLRRDYGRRIVSNPRHRPPGAACPNPQQRLRGEREGR